MLFLSCFRYALVHVCLEKAALFALVCDNLLRVCYLPIGIVGQVWYLIVSISDLCPLSYLNTYNNDIVW